MLEHGLFNSKNILFIFLIEIILVLLSHDRILPQSDFYMIDFLLTLSTPTQLLLNKNMHVN